VARAIAAAVRERDGGLPGVQALGLRLRGTGRAQVSMNLIDVAATSLHAVVARVARLAAAHGVEVERGELVGLMPAATAAAAAGAALRIDGMAADRVLEVAAGGEFGG
jgi:glutamate formiminotransferase